MEALLRLYGDKTDSLNPAYTAPTEPASPEYMVTELVRVIGKQASFKRNKLLYVTHTTNKPSINTYATHMRTPLHGVHMSAHPRQLSLHPGAWLALLHPQVRSELASNGHFLCRDVTVCPLYHRHG